MPKVGLAAVHRVYYMCQGVYKVKDEPILLVDSRTYANYETRQWPLARHNRCAVISFVTIGDAKKGWLGILCAHSFPEFQQEAKLLGK